LVSTDFNMPGSAAGRKCVRNRLLTEITWQADTTPG
jgi:hypothetical protein